MPMNSGYNVERRFFSSVPLLAKPLDFNKRKTKKKREKKRLKTKMSRFYTGHFTNSTHNYFYSASATTSFTSGIILFIIPSIPAFKVIMEDGQPLQLPCNIRFTVPSL